MKLSQPDQIVHFEREYQALEGFAADLHAVLGSAAASVPLRQKKVKKLVTNASIAW